jgi:hypothetical protein
VAGQSELKIKIFLDLKTRKEMEKTNPMSGTVMLTQPGTCFFAFIFWFLTKKII